LNRDHQIGLVELDTQLVALARKLGDVQRIEPSRINLGSAPLRRQCRQLSRLALASPVLKEDEYTPSRRSKAPISPGLVQRSAAAKMRRLSASEKCRRRACGTTSEEVPGGTAGAADPLASSVSLRAPCDASGSGRVCTACMDTFG